jgi:hypothetical protein
MVRQPAIPDRPRATFRDRANAQEAPRIGATRRGRRAGQRMISARFSMNPYPVLEESEAGGGDGFTATARGEQERRTR